MSNDASEYVDPEPWVHRWPNEPSGVRSANEDCTVADCEATLEPRTGRELQRLLERKSVKKSWIDRLVAWWIGGAAV